MAENYINIDGSVLEGGGQILRISTALSVLCNIPIKIFNIRAGRKKPGLMHQHLKGILLVKEMSKGIGKGVEMGSTEIKFSPVKITSGEYFADAETAGSIALLLQIALPCCYFANGPTTLTLRGGTNAEMAPQIDYITEVFKPNLEKFGVTFDFDLIRRGYFPKGGGEVSVQVNPAKCFNSIHLTEQGNITKLFGWSFVAGVLPIKLAHSIADAAVRELQKKVKNVNIVIERYKENPQTAPDNCSGIILVCETSTGCIIGGSALGKRGISAEETGIKAAEEILETLNSKACVDSYIQDQVILFMALAKGHSKICAGDITLHTKTAIYIIEQLTNVRFIISPSGSHTNIIECDGLGLMNNT